MVKHTLSSKKVDSFGKYLVKAVATNAIWTNERLKDAGYDTDGQCPLCSSQDSLHHRLWCCTAVEAERLKACPAWLVHEARQDLSNPLWSRGIFPHPAAHPDFPSPVVDGGHVVSHHDGSPMSPLDIQNVMFKERRPK